jgi:putative transposase
VSQPWGSGAELTDEVLNREVFFTLKEAKVVIENWRREYNTITPDSSLNYRPRAPEATLPSEFQQPWLTQRNLQVASTLT